MFLEITSFYCIKLRIAVRLDPSINLIKRVVYWFNELAILVEKIIKKTDRIIAWL